MTIVRNDSADGFVKRPPPEMRFFLLHGVDEGLIHERAKSLVHAILGGDTEPLRLVRVDGDALAREPGRLADEVLAISMFGGLRVIWVEAQARDLTPLFEPLLGGAPPACAVVVEAASLKKGSSLRTAFEKAANAVSVECYPDERRGLLSLIDAEARQAGLQVTPEAREYLWGLMGSDRMATRGEIEKLMLYAAGMKTIDLAEVEAIVADATPSGLDALIDQALLGNLVEVARASRRLLADGGDTGLLVTRLVSRVGQLHRIRLNMEQGKSFDAALQEQFIRVSPSGRASLERQAERWTSAALAKRLPAIQTLAARSRRDTQLGQAIAIRALWALATGVRQSRG